jgi:prepilin-type N-terminal cleavage/methylation domain-containing protein
MSDQLLIKKAFTLVELLVVIAIVGLLSTIVLAVTSGVSEQGRIAKGLQFSQHLQNALGANAAGIWRFDEGTGTVANDASGWGNNGTLINTPTWRCANVNSSYAPSGQGCSLEFNGSTQYMNAGNGASLNITDKLTIESWIYPKEKKIQQIIDKRASSSAWKGYWLEMYTSTIYLGVGNGTSHVNLGYEYNYNINTWYHIVGVYDNGNWAIYVNGQLGNSGYTAVTISDSGNSLTLGADFGNYIFNGLIDETRLYNASLTSTQIQSQYRTGLDRLLAKGSIDETEYQERLTKN